jgi:membrane-associated phospholipid phosphatase
MFLEDRLPRYYRRISSGLLCVAVLAVHMPAQQPVAAIRTRDSAATNLSGRDLGIGAAAVALLFFADKPIARVFHGYYGPNTRTIAQAFDKFGEPTGMAVVLGGLGIAALATRDKGMVRTLVRTAGAVAIASGVSETFKYAIGRLRPYADPDRDALDFRPFRGAQLGTPSFPSGHTTVAFALATSLGDASHNRWVRLGLWGVAAGTGWARLQLDQHWVTDIVAGAAVGILSARFAEGRLRVLGVRAPRLIVSPRSLGVGWTLPLPAIR